MSSLSPPGSSWPDESINNRLRIYDDAKHGKIGSYWLTKVLRESELYCTFYFDTGLYEIMYSTDIYIRHHYKSTFDFEYDEEANELTLSIYNWLGEPGNDVKIVFVSPVMIRRDAKLHCMRE